MSTSTFNANDQFTPTILPHPNKTAAEYILTLFEPDDLIAIMTKRDGESPEHRFAKAEEVASAPFMESLRKWNKAGCDIYVCMNPLSAKRRVKQNIACIRSVYSDIDQNGEAAIEKISQSMLAPKPHFVLQTSPGKFQVVWLVEDIQPTEQETLLDALIDEFGGDPAASDMTRVLRLPDFVNHKYESKPIVELIETNFNGLRCRRDDFNLKTVPFKKTEKIPTAIESGKRNTTLVSLAGSMRRRGASEDAILAALKVTNLQRCRTPLDDSELVTIARSIARYPPVEENEPAETVTPLIVPYPVFPYWVMEGTSIYTGLVEPECRANCKYEEFLFMPAFVLLLNYVMIRTRVERHTQTTGILLVNIGERGQALKSASCDLAFEYMFRVGLGKKFSRSLNPLDLQERSLIVTAGSPEGFLSKMAKLDCLHGILYYDELSKLVSKASIESSSMVPDLCTMLESGEFSSITLKNSPVLNAGEYCVSVIANTPSKSFLHIWAQLHGNESTGLEDRAFFLLEPRTKKPRTPRTDVSFSGGEIRTRERVDAAMARRVFPARDWQLFNDAIEHLGTRAEVRAEIFALGFAVDLGRDCIDDDCKRRGIALAEYDLATKHYLRPIEAETKQGAVQQEIVRTLEHAGGQMPYRELCQTMHSARLGSDVWDRAILGLEHGLTPRIKIVKGTPGRAGKPTMVYLLPETD